MPVELENIIIRSLMVDGVSAWDVEVLNDICNERDVELIKRIPLPMINSQDFWMWILYEKGVFTVKSCYRKLQGKFMTPYTSFWKKLWYIKVPGKVINFL